MHFYFAVKCIVKSIIFEPNLIIIVMKESTLNYSRKIAAKVMLTGFVALILLMGAGCGKDKCCRPMCNNHGCSQNGQNGNNNNNGSNTTSTANGVQN
jgi:hypothetical protein